MEIDNEVDWKSGKENKLKDLMPPSAYHLDGKISHNGSTTNQDNNEIYKYSWELQLC